MAWMGYTNAFIVLMSIKMPEKGGMNFKISNVNEFWFFTTCTYVWGMTETRKTHSYVADESNQAQWIGTYKKPHDPRAFGCVSHRRPNYPKEMWVGEVGRNLHV